YFHSVLFGHFMARLRFLMEAVLFSVSPYRYFSLFAGIPFYSSLANIPTARAIGTATAMTRSFPMVFMMDHVAFLFSI
ncbi:MAG: hypothetical protein IKR65_01305, partial [Selenomonadaceae bacterium]|nr:hypothetical protein [Selenomonadaceae bacterium]